MNCSSSGVTQRVSFFMPFARIFPAYLACRMALAVMFFVRSSDMSFNGSSFIHYSERSSYEIKSWIFLCPVLPFLFFRVC